MADPQENPSGFSVKKKVDESWKGAVEKEKGDEEPENPDASESAPIFASFLSTLGMQALFALGELPDPASPELKTDLSQAKYLIDVIQVLSDKTRNNLSEKEADMMKDLLYSLRMKFVEKAKKTP